MTHVSPARSDPRTHRGRVGVLCLLSTVACAALAVWWTSSERIGRLQGDEPHYLIMSASVLRDADFDLRNSYAFDAETNEI